jgi:hypothetical protein
MYTSPMFRSDRAASLALADACGFGAFRAWNGNQSIVARGNPLIGLADGQSCWLVAVNGADAYVSPDWFVSPDLAAIASVLAGQHNEARAIGQRVVALRRLMDYKSPAPAGAPAA